MEQKETFENNESWSSNIDGIDILRNSFSLTAWMTKEVTCTVAAEQTLITAAG